MFTPALLSFFFVLLTLLEAPAMSSAAATIPFQYGPAQARKLLALVLEQVSDETVVELAQVVAFVASEVEGANPFVNDPKVVPPRAHMMPPAVEEAAIACARAIEPGPAGRPLVSSPTDDNDPYSRMNAALLASENIPELQARWAEVQSMKPWGKAELDDLTATKDTRKKALLGAKGGA